MNEKKGTVILSTGPLYLFWTSGIYYLWELSRNFRVVLIVDESYERDPSFKKIVSLADVIHVLYLPAVTSVLSGKSIFFKPFIKIKNIMSRHRYYLKSFREIVKQHMPVFVFQHNAPYVDNIYLFNVCRKLKSECYGICYQTSRLAISLDEDYNARHSFGIESVKRKYNIPVWIAKIIYYGHNLLSYWLNYYLVPIILTGRSLNPLYNVNTGKLNCKGNKLKDRIRERYDLTLAYYRVELENMQERRGYEEDFIQIKHPVETVGEELNKLLYEDQNNDIITILPTYGYTSRQIIEKGAKEEDIEVNVSEMWISALKILINKLPNHRLVWKLHPNAIRDSLWQKITRRIKDKLPDMELLPVEANGEELIISSKIVVTDISSVFWFANFLPGKIVISLDIFGYDSGDEARYYEGVLYFNSLSDLSAMDLDVAKRCKAATRAELPTLAEALFDIVSDSGRGQ